MPEAALKATSRARRSRSGSTVPSSGESVPPAMVGPIIGYIFRSSDAETSRGSAGMVESASAAASIAMRCFSSASEKQTQIAPSCRYRSSTPETSSISRAKAGHSSAERRVTSA